MHKQKGNKAMPEARIWENLARGFSLEIDENWDLIQPLYYFDATEHSVWALPSGLVEEDGGSYYSIANDAQIGNYIAKSNAADKLLRFNNYEAFAENIKARFFFYVTSATNYAWYFSISVVNWSNTWGFWVGLEDNGWLSKTVGARFNTNAWFFLAESVSNVQNFTLVPGQLYVAEMYKVNTDDDAFILSLDGWATRSAETIRGWRTNHKRVAAMLTAVWSQKIMLQRVEVYPADE